MLANLFPSSNTLSLESGQTVTLGLMFRVRCNFSYISIFLFTTKREPSQYQLLTPCDYVLCGARVAKVQVRSRIDPLIRFFKFNLINILVLNE